MKWASFIKKRPNALKGRNSAQLVLNGGNSTSCDPNLDARHYGYLVYKDHSSKDTYHRNLRRRRRNLKLVETHFSDVLGRYRSYRGGNTVRILGDLLGLLKTVEPKLFKDFKSDPRLIIKKLKELQTVGVVKNEPKPTDGDDSVPWIQMVSLALGMLIQKCDEVLLLQDELEILYNENSNLNIRLHDAYSKFENVISKTVLDATRSDTLLVVQGQKILDLTEQNIMINEANDRLYQIYLDTRDQFYNTENDLALRDLDLSNSEIFPKMPLLAYSLNTRDTEFNLADDGTVESFNLDDASDVLVASDEEWLNKREANSNYLEIYESSFFPDDDKLRALSERRNIIQDEPLRNKEVVDEMEYKNNVTSCYLSLEKVFHSLLDTIRDLNVHVPSKPTVVFDRIESLEHENKCLHDIVSKLHSKVNSDTQNKISMTSQLSQLKMEAFHSKQALSKLQMQSEVILMNSKENALLKSSNDSFSQQVQRMEGLVARINSEKQQLERQLFNTQTKLVSTNKECDVLKSEILKMRSLATNENFRDAMEHQITNIHLKGDVARLKEESEQHAREADLLKKTNTSLMSDLVRLQNDLEREKRVNIEITSQLNSNSESKLRTQLDNYVIVIEGLKEENSSINNLLKAAHAEVSTLSQKVYEQQLEISQVSKRLETVSSCYRDILATIAGMNPIRISQEDFVALEPQVLGPDPGIYRGIFQSIQNVSINPNINIFNEREHSSQLKAVNDKLASLFQYNYLLANLSISLCKELHRMDRDVSQRLQSDINLIIGIKSMADADLVTLDNFNKQATLTSRVQELDALVQRLGNASCIERLEKLHKAELVRTKEELNSLEAQLQTRDKTLESLQKRNEELLQDCMGAAKAITEFEQRLDDALTEKAKLSQELYSIIPESQKSICNRDDWRAGIEALSRLVTSLEFQVKRADEELQKAKKDAREAASLTLPTPVPAPRSVQVQYKMQAPPSLKEFMSSFNYYCRAIKDNIRDQIRDHNESFKTDSETDFEASPSLDNESDDTRDYRDNLDYESPLSDAFENTADPDGINRKVNSYFEGILELLDHLRSIHHTSMLSVAKNNKRGSYEATSVGDVSLIHHFSQLCVVLREALVGTPQQFRLDDLLYQIQSLPTSTETLARRRHIWSKCIGSIVSIVTSVLQHDYREKRGAISEATLQIDALKTSLNEARTMHRVQQMELQQRTAHITHLEQKLKAMQQYVQRCEDSHADTFTSALKRHTQEKDTQIEQLVNDSRRLQNVIRECENVNSQLYQQLEHSTAKIQELNLALRRKSLELTTLRSERGQF
ncbi:hypothetical protein BdWA1_001336 [Babesia duncani]|uniref:Uncharacterized protein n=1 Tax=Babesia duncani TaxID=323732 RepID=A0AAD9UQV6_9APIC|nr:hypothetical protein BdWA1_001336 [Babesia duncani]